MNKKDKKEVEEYFRKKLQQYERQVYQLWKDKQKEVKK